MKINYADGVISSIRYSSRNNPFGYPIENLIQNESSFKPNVVDAEYCVYIDGFEENYRLVDIPKFNVVKNVGIARFDFDNQTQKWYPLPGSKPELIGVISADAKFKVPIPNTSLLDSHPIRVVILSQNKTYLVFTPVTVDQDADVINGVTDFTISIESGRLFIPVSILATYLSCELFFCRQQFFARDVSDGYIGTFEEYAKYKSLVLNPHPGAAKPIIMDSKGKYYSKSNIPNISAGQYYCDDNGIFSILQYEGTDLTDSIYYLGTFDKTVFPKTWDISLDEGIGLHTDLLPIFRQLGLDPLAERDRYLIYVHHHDVYLSSTYDELNELQLLVGAFIIPDGNYLIDGNKSLYISDDYAHEDRFNLTIIDRYVEIEHGICIKLYPSLTKGEADYKSVYSSKGAFIADLNTPAPFVFLPSLPMLYPAPVYSVITSRGTTELKNNPYGVELDRKKKRLSFVANRTDYPVIMDKPSSVLVLPDSVIDSGTFNISKDEEELNNWSLDASAGRLEFYDNTHAVGYDSVVKLKVESNVVKSIIPSISLSDQRYFFYGKKFHKIGTNSECDLPDGEYQVKLTNVPETILEQFWAPVSINANSVRVEYSSDKETWSVIDSDLLKYVSEKAIVQCPESYMIPGYSYRVTYDLNGTKIENESVSFKYVETVSIKDNSISINSRNQSIDTSKNIEIALSSSTINYKPSDLPEDRVIILPAGSGDQATVTYYVYECQSASNQLVLKNVDFTVNGARITKSALFLPIGSLEGYRGSILKFKSDGDDYVCSIASSAEDGAYTKHVISGVDATYVSYNISEFSVLSLDDMNFSFDPSAEIFGTIVKADAITLSGDSSSTIKPGHLIKITSMESQDSLGFVTSVQYDSLRNQTFVKVHGRLTAYDKYNIYVSKSVIKSTDDIIFPIKPINTTFPYNIYLVNDNESSISGARLLTKDVDYSVSESGFLINGDSVAFTFYDKLVLNYTGNAVYPEGSEFKVAYKAMIAPSTENGLLGGKLYCDYSVYQPDSYYFKSYTIKSYIPELVSDMSSQSSGSSGPSMTGTASINSSTSGLQCYDWDVLKYHNLDYLCGRLLAFMTGVANDYDDIISNITGDIVGGSDGAFKYDGNPGKLVTSSQVSLNQMDDFTQEERQDIGFLGDIQTVREDVQLYQYGSSSRVYNTKRKFYNTLVGNTGYSGFGTNIGYLGVRDILKTSDLTKVDAISLFKRESTNTILADLNGNTAEFVSAFRINEPVEVYDHLGSLSGTATLKSINFDTTPVAYRVELEFLPGSIFEVPLFGSIHQSGGGDSYGTIYDVYYDSSSGALTNISLPLLPGQKVLPDPGTQMQATINYTNKSTKPSVIPALMGASRNDDGHYPIPILSRVGLIKYYQDAVERMSKPDLLGYGTLLHQGGKIILQNRRTARIAVGSLLFYREISQSGIILNKYIGTVENNQGLVSPGYDHSYTVTPYITPVPDFNSDIFYYNAYYVNSYENSVLLAGDYGGTSFNPEADKILWVNNTFETSSNTTKLIPDLTSITNQIRNMISSYGNEYVIRSGNFPMSPGVIRVSGVDSALVNGFVYITGTNNFGIYKIKDIFDDRITIDSTSEFGDITDDNAMIFIYGLMPLLNFSGLKVLSDTAKKINDMKLASLEFNKSWDATDFEARVNTMRQYILDLKVIVRDLKKVLTSTETLYTRRLTWLNKKYSKTQGYTTLMEAAVSKKKGDLEQLIESLQAKKDLANLA